jgi:Putative addiction module component
LKIARSKRFLSAARQLKLLKEPDADISAAWVVEAQNRLAAYKRGELQAAPIASLFEQLRSE